MANKSNQPRNDDAVLGGYNPPPRSGMVLGGIQGVKVRLSSPFVEERIAAASEALKYGDAGLDLILQALQDDSGQVRRIAHLLLWERTEPHVRQAIQNYAPTDMVACWRLDETEGKTATDSVGSHHGTIEGATPTTIVPGRMPGLGGAGNPDEINPDSYRFVEFVLPKGLGSALSFDGNDYVEVPNAPELNFGTGDFSICIGIKTRSRGGIDVILDKRVEISGSVQGYCCCIYQGRLLLQLADGIESEWTNYDSQFAIADDKWHHIVVTIDRDCADGGRWYVDGIEVGKRFNPTNRQGSVSNFKPLIMGRRSDNSSSPGFFKGSMSDVRLFNRVLDAAEVPAIYQVVGVRVTRSSFQRGIR
ncbi:MULTISPECIES: LamG domain-containing protein [unclassified Coleofasciculus]|uniref:LamG domain-containing protein n=1 Tax=unclassified Coleofasciculus TaxID=2692782 RepID=UPI00187E6EB4|nr:MULTISPECIES: LamG domain-containing protein [unclassified Coleofasciculus]MBE9129868.1 LamG domain-containing protein [Coleofasciculus sp. LEGE 07081]MBE9147896.1 LamG domain-containing protein [Coleofasciculus sp. LEGE 07092]